MNGHRILILAALFAGAASLSPLPAHSGSCCGGGDGGGLFVPKYFRSMIDLSFEMESYNGYWDQQGIHRSDPPGSDLRQYRLNLGYGRRFDPRWQAGIMVPFVWNRNSYSGLSSSTKGFGDTVLSLWYEALDDVTAWRVRSIKDMKPSVRMGPSLLVPTGVSPYDDVGSSFDVTGRGFYRLDGNFVVTKTINPWSASLSLAYGVYPERKVNREYGRYIEPYRKKLGDRTSASLSLGYIVTTGTGGDSLTGTASLSRLQENDSTIDGATDAGSGIRKDAIALSLLFSGFNRDWTARVSWNHAFPGDQRGTNFPTTDIYTLGVSYGFP